MKAPLAAALLLSSVAMPAGAAQGQAQTAAPAPALDNDAQCAMFMRNVSVAMMMRGNLNEGERAYLARYGVLLAYFAGRFSIGHDPAASLPVLTATVRDLSREVQARMDCYHDGDRITRDLQAQIERAVPAGGSPGGGTAAPADAAGEDARCIAAVQHIVNQDERLRTREEMRNPNRILWTIDYLAGRMVARGGSTALEPAVAAAFAALPADQAEADALGFRCVADNSRAQDAFSDGIAAAERAAEEAGPAGK